MLKSIPLFFFLDGAMNGVAGRIFGREECKNPAICEKLRGFFLTFFDFASGKPWRVFSLQNQILDAYKGWFADFADMQVHRKDMQVQSKKKGYANSFQFCRRGKGKHKKERICSE